ncbi:MAG: ATP-binding protein [Microcoleaceae cyanobacterium MO_207.B10]|nr:ATP-binding protein [Microcoleaceae cyanobacterium MO_207.B10]
MPSYLINEVLNFSKIEAGVIDFQENQINLYNLIDRLEEMFKIQAQEKNIKLYFQISPEVPQNIKTDEHKLRVCLINLLGNPIKFTNHGSFTLAVTTTSEPLKTEKKVTKLVADSQNYLSFSICDTGSGIPPEEIDNIFK